MRSWSDWTSEEHVLFARVNRDDKNIMDDQLMPAEYAYIKKMVHETMLERPLTVEEIAKINNILDCAIAGILTKEAV